MQRAPGDKDESTVLGRDGGGDPRVLSLVVPIPRTERHGIQMGDASVGIKTQTEEKVSPIVSVVMIAGGALMMFGGGRGRAAA